MIVMKFGGTSVQDTKAVRSVIEIVSDRRQRRPLVVVSAMAGVTNQLLAIANLAVSGAKQDAAESLNQLKIRHLAVAEDLIHDHHELDALDHHLNDSIARLVDLIEGVSLLGELTNRSLDVFAAQGELLSSFILAAAMREAGLTASWFDVREVMLTDQNYTAAAPHMPSLNKLSIEKLQPLIERSVVVTQGFIGRTHDGVTTTLGRGGSDYTAALLGSALSAEVIEIWTDVDGVLTSDPRMVDGVARVRQMSFREAAELAYFGARVLHPATIFPAIEKNIPVYVYNTHRPQSSGTLIAQHVRLSGDQGVIKSIAHKKNITILNISSSRMLLAHGFMASIFDIFRKHQTGVDVVSTTEVSVSLTIDDSTHMDAIVADLSAFSQVQVERDRAIVCLVGEQMRYTPGIAARIFNAIRDININMISQGASEINVTFVISQDDVGQVIRRLHHEFFSGPLPTDLFDKEISS